MLPFKNLLVWIFCIVVLSTSAQTIATFNSIQPATQTQNLVLPTTHTFQRIIRSGNTLSSGETVGINLDFTGYVPISGSSSNGYLSISSERVYAGAAILSVSLNPTTKLWAVSNGGNVPLPFSDLGYANAFCAGTVMPNGHVMVCEETMAGADYNGDGYNDDGWIIEIDPASRTVINQDGVGGVDKLWAMGRQKHEDVVMTPDMSVAYWSADNDTAGYVYKFVPAVPGNFSAGNLYVLQTTASLGGGTWKQIPNTTAAEQNNTTTSAKDAGAYNFVRVEGIERGPDGKIYFAATTSGRIYRFNDLGNTVDQLEVFVESTDYDVDGAGPYPPVAWGNGADNLAFDGEGNLWVLQDGGNDYIWVVAPDHTAANPKVKLFAIMPGGSEPTGITFSPDYKYLFMSVQHPNNSNTSSQTDAAGNAVVFDESTAIVIARQENLGANVPLPVNLTSFDARTAKNTVELSWKTANISNDEFTIERSINSVHFDAIGTVKELASSFRFVDDKLPLANNLYYRLRQKDKDGKIVYSETKTINIEKQNILRLFPSPVSDKLIVRLSNAPAGQISATIINASGVTISRWVRSAANNFEIHVKELPAGTYYLIVETAEGRSTASFTKQ